MRPRWLEELGNKGIGPGRHQAGSLHQLAEKSGMSGINRQLRLELPLYCPLFVDRHPHTGITPCLRHGRWIFLVAAISSPRMIRGRVSRGSMMSSTMSLPAAM